MGKVELEIQFNRDLAIYDEGERVTGKLVITVFEEVRYKAIRIEAFGGAVVYWHEAESTDHVVEVLTRDAKVKGDKEEYFHKNLSLSQKDKDKDETPVLQPGTHKFPFEFKLPPELPTSYEGQYGQICYVTKAVLECLLLSTIVTKKTFKVYSGLNLNFIPESLNKIEICKHKEFGRGCCSTGSVTIDWTVKQSGYTPGEKILIHGAVQNECSYMVEYTRAVLYMVVKYRSKKGKRSERKELACVDKGETLPGEVTVWQDPLVIPPVPATGLSRSMLIDTSYVIEFSACFEGKCEPLLVTKDIYVGTIPVSQSEIRSFTAGMYNQPHPTPSTSNMPYTSSQVSLTDIIATAAFLEPVQPTTPSAPSMATINRHIDVRLPASTAEDLRPPPFSPTYKGSVEFLSQVEPPAEGGDPIEPSAP